MLSVRGEDQTGKVKSVRFGAIIGKVIPCEEILEAERLFLRSKGVAVVEV
jgi:hypothetical protein